MLFQVSFMIGVIGFAGMPLLHHLDVIDLIESEWKPLWLLFLALAFVSCLGGILTV